MVRIGENVVAIQTDGKNDVWVALEPKPIALGDRVICIPDGAGGYIAVKPLNTYVQDDGICMTMPCGGSTFLPGEPPNYLPPSWESGVGMSCQQGVPETNGWGCKSSCPINPQYHPTPGETCKRYYGELNFTDGNSCTHATGSEYWKNNYYTVWDYFSTWYNCNPTCPKRYNMQCWVYGTGTERITYRTGGYGGSKYPNGCSLPNNRRLESGPTYKVNGGGDAYNAYGCTKPPYGGNGATCPLNNNGIGMPFAVCTANPRPPSYSPSPNKPASCKQQAHLEFSGWSVPGGSQSKSSGSCVLNKATEGAKDSSDGNISCVFSR